MLSFRRHKIGYALAPKKRGSFIQPSLVALAASRGIDLVPIDPDVPLSSQGPFDCVLHKLSGHAWESQLLAYSSANPHVPVLDHPSAIRRLHDRISMLQFVSDLHHVPDTDTDTDTETYGVPNQIVVHHRGAFLDLTSLKFPLIAKPLVADGSAGSHKMVLVFNREGLGFLELDPPIVLQEFVNHGGVIFKVYVVGDYVRCVKRKSLPDVAEEGYSEVGSVAFSQVSNMSVRYKTEEKYYKKMQLEDAEMPPSGLIAGIARGLRRAMGLNLFNFDVIRDVKVGNHYLVIDINYFPGYAKMPSYETVLTDFFWDVVHKEEKDKLERAEDKVPTVTIGEMKGGS